MGRSRHMAPPRCGIGLEPESSSRAAVPGCRPRPWIGALRARGNPMLSGDVHPPVNGTVKRLRWLPMALTLALVAVACGGGSTATPGPDSQPYHRRCGDDGRGHHDNDDVRALHDSQSANDQSADDHPAHDPGAADDDGTQPDRCTDHDHDASDDDHGAAAAVAATGRRWSRATEQRGARRRPDRGEAVPAWRPGGGPSGRRPMGFRPLVGDLVGSRGPRDPCRKLGTRTARCGTPIGCESSSPPVSWALVSFSATYGLSIRAVGEWELLAPDGAGPANRYGSCAGYDPIRNRVLVSHGFTDFGRFDDTWAYSLADGTWTDISPEGERPIERCLHACTYDAAAAGWC